MALITGEQINSYWERYGEIQVTFNRPVAQALRLLPEGVYLKCHGETFPCLIHCSSMKAARIIVSLHVEALQKIRLAKDVVSLRFAFERAERSEPLAFFLPARITSQSPDNAGSPDLYLLGLEYIGKPPDDLIEMLGYLLESNINARRRREERIDINPATMRALGLDSKEAILLVGERPQPCLLRDLSFSGAKVLLFGTAENLLQRPVALRLAFGQNELSVTLPGTILRYEPVEGRREIGAAGIHFDERRVPMGYKLRLNNCLRGHRPATSPATPAGDPEAAGRGGDGRP
jgi:hypothetical protein